MTLKVCCAGWQAGIGEHTFHKQLLIKRAVTCVVAAMLVLVVKYTSMGMRNLSLCSTIMRHLRSLLDTQSHKLYLAADTRLIKIVEFSLQQS